MKALYTILGYIIWNQVMEVVKKIQNLRDEEFNRLVQSVGPEEKRMAMKIRDLKENGHGYSRKNY